MARNLPNGEDRPIMTTTITVAELAAWNRDHPMGTHVRWVDSRGAVCSGRIMGPARFVADTTTAVVKITDQAELRPIDGLSVMPPIETVNEFMIGRRGGKVTIGLIPHNGMEPDQALRMAAWLVVMADPGSTDRFNTIMQAIEGS